VQNRRPIPARGERRPPGRLSLALAFPVRADSESKFREWMRLFDA
jgi:hypothetical protein